MSRKEFFVLVFVTMTCALCSSISYQYILPFRVLAGVMLVLVLPGYALSAALFMDQLPRAERWLIVCALSLVISVLGGFLLNETSWGLRDTTWGMYLGAITVVFALVGLVRGTHGKPDSLPHNPYSIRQISLFVAAVMILTGSFVVAYNGAKNQRYSGFTQLWITPTNKETKTITVGFRNEENTQEIYQLKLFVDGTMMQQWDNVVLPSGQQWQKDVSLADTSDKHHNVEVVLFRNNQLDVPYRQVTLGVSP